MMDQNSDKDLEEALEWVEGLWNPHPYGEGESSRSKKKWRVKEPGIESSVSKAITQNTVKGNGAKRGRPRTADKTVNIPDRSSAVPKQMGSLTISDGHTPQSNVAFGSLSYMYNRPMHATIQRSFGGNGFDSSSRFRVPVCLGEQRQSFPETNVAPPNRQTQSYLPPHLFQPIENCTSMSQKGFNSQYLRSRAPNVPSANSTHWRILAYEEFQFLRRKFLEELTKQWLANKSFTGGKASQLEEMGRFLMTPKAEFFQYSKEKFKKMFISIAEYIMLEI